jgi:hypothetical protein
MGMSYASTVIKTSLVLCGIFTIGCNKSEFPTNPTPVAGTPLTTVQGVKLSGNAIVAGAVTSFSMTLIARAVDATAPGAPNAQTPGTTEVTGNFELGTGVKGSVAGTLDGTLDNGTFRGNLLADTAGGCSRQYTGVISGGSIAWLSDAGSNCPLPSSIQSTNRTNGPTCNFSISPFSTVSGSGTSATVTVTTGPSCTWVVESLVPWARIVGSPIVTGSGSVTLAIDLNSEAARQGTVSVAGQSLTISQGPACAFTVAPGSVTIGSSGGSAAVSVTAAGGCDWKAESLPDWLAASPSTGSGTGTVTLTAQPNFGQQRQVAIQIAGQSVTIVQQAAGPTQPTCTLSIVPTTASFPVNGGNGTIDITAPPGCDWATQTDVTWIQINATSSGSGTGRVTFTVLANTGDARSGSIRLDGQTLTVRQDGVDIPLCTYTLSGSGYSFSAAGGTGSVTVTTQPGCAWSAQTLIDWITIQPPSGFVGSGTATYMVAPNTLGTGRGGTGELRVANRTIAVTQAPLFIAGTVTLTATPVGQRYGGGTVSTATGFTCTLEEVDLTERDPRTGKDEGCVLNTAAGQPVTLRAAPATLSEFTGWTGPCVGTALTCTFTPTAAGFSVGATFRSKAILSVFVYNEPSGGPTVTSVPVGISCGPVSSDSDTCDAGFVLNTLVTLTSSSATSLWDGCDAPATPNTPSRTCQVTMTRSRNVLVLPPGTFSGLGIKKNVSFFDSSSLLQATRPRKKPDD